ncbi:MAG: ATP-binding protein [Armatimonadota bacterium]
MLQGCEARPGVTLRLLHQMSRVRILFAVALLVGLYLAPPNILTYPAVAYGSVAMAALLAAFSYFAADWKRERALGRLGLTVALTIIGDVFVISLFMWATGGTYSHFLTLLLCDVVFAGIFFHGIELVFIVGMISFSFANVGLLYGFTPTTMWQVLTGITGAIIIAWLSGGLGRVLRLERAANERIMNDIARPVCVVDDRGRIVLVNPHFERLAEVSVSDVIGRTISELTGDNCTSRCCELLSGVAALIKDVKPQEQELTLADDTEGTMSIVRRILPCEVDFGEPPGWVITWQVMDEVDQTVRAMEQGVMVVSHELRGPISSLRVLIEVLQGVAGELDDDKRQQIIERLATETERLSRLVASILELARFDRPDFTLDRTKTNILPLLEHVAELFEPRAEQAGLTFRTDFCERNLQVECDADRLEQVFINLCENAVNYTPAGETIELSLRQQGDSVECSVSDTGPGIPRECRETIFHKFTTGHNTLQSGRGRSFGDGLGIGLALVKRIVSLHDGSINLTTEVGEGTTFTVILPVCEVPQREIESATVAD